MVTTKMCNSFEEFDRCQKCSKTWNIDFHTIFCNDQHCRLIEPAIIEPVINSNLCTFCKRLDAPAEQKRLGSLQKLEPLVWESDSTSFSCVWTASR